MSDQKSAAMEMAATVSSAASKTTYAGAASGFVAHRGTIEKDLDFIQIFKDKQIHTANKLISYLDYISN